MFPNRVPMDRDTPITRATGLFIHSFVYVCQSPQKGALLHMGKNIRSSSTEPHAEGRPTYNGMWPGSPRGLLTTLLSLPQCHAVLSMIPSTLASVDQSPVSMSQSNPHQGIPSTTVTASHMTQGRIEYESMIPTGMDKVSDLWKADETDDDMLWNASEEDGYVRSECDEDEGTDCEDGDSDTGRGRQIDDWHLQPKHVAVKN